jgi:hypothetical protein
MRAWLIAALLALGAPSALAQDTVATPHRAIQNGDTVDAVAGGKFMLQLGVNEASGEHWDVAQKPDFLGAAIIVVTPTPGQALGPGAPELATISFEVTGTGSGPVVLVMHGPAAHAPPLATFRVTVRAQ